MDMLVRMGVVDKGKVEHTIRAPESADGLATVGYERVDPLSAWPPLKICTRSRDRFRRQVDSHNHIIDSAVLRSLGDDRGREAGIRTQLQNLTTAEIYHLSKH